MGTKIAALVKRLRKERKLTQAQVGQLAGYSRDTIIQIEKGTKEHGYSTVESVLLALGASADDIRAIEASGQSAALSPEERELLRLYGDLGTDDRHWLIETARRLYAMALARTPDRAATPGHPKKGKRTT